MADAQPVLTARSALAAVYAPGRFGRSDGEPGITLAERDGLAILQIEAWPGQASALPGILATAGAGAALLPVGPDRWHLVGPAVTCAAVACAIPPVVASTLHLGEGRTCLRVAGRDARALLMKGAAIDFDPAVTPAGRTLATALHRIGVVIHVVDDAPTFDVYVYRGFAQSLWEILIITAKEFGGVVLPPIAAGRGSGGPGPH